MFKYLCFLVFLSVASVANAVDVFVDNTASCSTDDGTSAHPWCSIQAALDNAAAGQDIKIRTGTGVYSEVTTVSGKNGTSGSPIILEKDTGASFVIRNTDSGSFTASIEIKESDYWTIRNLTFDANGVNPSMMAIHVQCSVKNCLGWNISGNTFQNWRQPAAATNGPNVLNFSGCHVDFGCATTKTITGTIENNTFTNNDHAAITLYVTLNTVVRNNIITAQRCGFATDVNTVGIQVQYSNYGLQIYNNQISDFTSIASCPRTTGATFTTSAGIWSDVCYGDENTDVYNNLIYNIDQGRTSYAGVVPGSSSHGSYGMFIEAGCGNYRVKRNIIYNIGNEGVANSYHSIGSSGVANTYSNNTIYGVLHGFCIKEGTLTVANNIVKNASGAAMELDCTSGDHTLVSLTADYNLYDDGASQTLIGAKSGVVYNLTNWKSQCSCDTNSTTGDPLFVSNGSNFNLTSTSPAINTGSATYAPTYNGSAPDKGAFERFAVLNAEIGSVANNKLVVNFSMSLNQPILISNTTGWTWTGGTISSVAVTGNTQLTFTLSSAYGGGASTITYTETTGNASDSVLIGNRYNQRLSGITTFAVTDNTGGAVLRGSTGYFVRTDCNGLSLPITNGAVCLQRTTTGGRTAGVLYKWNGTSWIIAAEQKLQNFTVATLPTSPSNGDTVLITDSTTYASCGSGGGTLQVPCYYDAVALKWIPFSSSTSIPTLQTVIDAGRSGNNAVDVTTAVMLGNGTLFHCFWVDSSNTVQTGVCDSSKNIVSVDKITKTALNKTVQIQDSSGTTVFGVTDTSGVGGISTAKGLVDGFSLPIVTGSTLTGSDDAVNYIRIPYAQTIAQVCAKTDTGTISVQLQRDDGSATNMLSSSLVATTSEACTTSFVSGENILSEGNYVDVLIVSIDSGSPKRLTVSAKTTRN